jgi:hypothetical protein
LSVAAKSPGFGGVRSMDLKEKVNQLSKTLKTSLQKALKDHKLKSKLVWRRPDLST